MVDCLGFSDMEWPQEVHLVVATFSGIFARSIEYVLLQYRQVTEKDASGGAAVCELARCSDMACPQDLHFKLETSGGILLRSTLYLRLQ